MEDISEGQTGFVAELRLPHQLLEERLPDWLSGVDPQPFRSGIPRNHLTVHILSGLPGKRAGSAAVSAVSLTCW